MGRKTEQNAPAESGRGAEKDTKLALQAAKEIVVKFIEVGRVTPQNFQEIFPDVYAVVLRAVAAPHETDSGE
ncbi:MAG: hypothetical protein H0S85_16465 [Desulfovibrionaceae bacterium]|jgi:hypothetical protein|nr:hypothetical protein [Desulfovibrionaceae bacterium]